jgi:hypothetical protein
MAPGATSGAETATATAGGADQRSAEPAEQQAQAGPSSRGY